VKRRERGKRRRERRRGKAEEARDTYIHTYTHYIT